MGSPGYGRILGIVAAAGLILLVGLFIYLRLYPPPGPGPAYDQVFKYCTEAYPGRADAAEAAAVANDPLYRRIVALKPGTYVTGNGEGSIHLFGQGMFEVALPSQLQVVRPVPGINSWSGSDRPRMVVGCTDAALARVLQAYGLTIEPTP